MKLSMATPPSSMSPVVSFRWEVTGCEEVTSLDRDDGRGKESQKGHCNHSVSNWTFSVFAHLLWMVCHLLIVVLVHSY